MIKHKEKKYFSSLHEMRGNSLFSLIHVSMGRFVLLPERHSLLQTLDTEGENAQAAGELRHPEKQRSQ